MLDMNWKCIGVSSPHDCRGIHKGLNLHQPEAERSAYCPNLVCSDLGKSDKSSLRLHWAFFANAITAGRHL